MNVSIIDYIPHRPPMVMVDELVYANAGTAESSFRILPSNIFVNEGKLSEPGLVENIAQTAAAMVGYLFSMQNKPIPIGYIAAIKNLEINLLPDVLSTIRTKVVVTNSVLDVTIIEGTVEQFGKLLCSCEMKIIIKENKDKISTY